MRTQETDPTPPPPTPTCAGSNDELKLVAEEAMLDGLLKEEEMIALLPKAHHTPAPFLA